MLPNVLVIKTDEGYDVLLNETGIPSIRLNKYYVKALKDTSIEEKTKN